MFKKDIPDTHHSYFVKGDMNSMNQQLTGTKVKNWHLGMIPRPPPAESEEEKKKYNALLRK